MTDLHKTLGPVIVASSGDGLYAKGIKKALPVTIEITLEPASIEREDGKISFAYCHFEAKFEAKNWDVAVLGHMYTDNGIVNSINQYLALLGYAGRVGWSEAGRQDRELCDFDMDYELITEIWPELAS